MTISATFVSPQTPEQDSMVTAPVTQASKPIKGFVAASVHKMVLLTSVNLTACVVSSIDFSL